MNPPNDISSKDNQAGAPTPPRDAGYWASLKPSQIILGVMFVPLSLLVCLGDPLLIAVTLSMIMAGHDIFDRTIPNLLNILTASLGLIIAWQTGGWYGLGASALVACGALVALIILYLFGLLGAGDVKALAALTTFTAGWQDAFILLLVVTLFGGAQAIIVALWEKWRQFAQRKIGNRFLTEITGLAASSSMMFKWLVKTWGGRPASSLGLKTQLPYGVAIFGGTLVWAMLRGWS